jgi:hypothetical protein
LRIVTGVSHMPAISAARCEIDLSAGGRMRPLSGPDGAKCVAIGP